ncbi:MAG: hypothetical protein ACI9U2_003978 [Bradymonadia bacterium]|jgi:uncharacterized protein (DUF2236 family)
MTALVTPADFETRLAETLADSPVVGGPFMDTMLWTVGRESALILAGGRAALMQLAHPYIADAVGEHSTIRANVQKRFRRTLSIVYRLTFDARDDVEETARRLYRLHARITGVLSESVGPFAQGTRYSANVSDALFWVAATLWDTSIVFHEQCVGTLTYSQKAAYYTQARRFCGLFGIPDAAMPRTWNGFEAYMRAQTARLAVGETARSLGQLVLTAQRPTAEPAYAWARIFTAGLLAPRLRAGFALPFGPREQAIHAASIHAIRYGLRTLPNTLRYTPAWHRAQARLGRRRGVGRASALVRQGALWLTARA